MSINDFIQDQIQKTYSTIMGNLLRFNGGFGDVRHMEALHLFGSNIKNGIGDENGIAVNDIRQVFVSCLSKFELVYSQPRKKKDKYAEIQLFKSVIFFIHAETLFKSGKYNESIRSLMDSHECLGASKVFKSDNLAHILDDDHKYTVSSSGGYKKAENEKKRKAPIYKKLEHVWDSGKWEWEGKKTGYSNFASWALHSEANNGLGHEAIRKHISDYAKSKNTD